MGKRKTAKPRPVESISIAGPFKTREEAEKFAVEHGVTEATFIPIPAESVRGKKPKGKKG